MIHNQNIPINLIINKFSRAIQQCNKSIKIKNNNFTIHLSREEKL